MFYEAKPTWNHGPAGLVEPVLSPLWSSLEKDPLGREKLESRIAQHIQLLLRFEEGDRQACHELQALA